MLRKFKQSNWQQLPSEGQVVGGGGGQGGRQKLNNLPKFTKDKIKSKIWWQSVPAVQTLTNIMQVSIRFAGYQSNQHFYIFRMISITSKVLDHFGNIDLVDLGLI